MYDLNFTEEQLQLRKTARDFARSKIAPLPVSLMKKAIFRRSFSKKAGTWA